MDDAEIRLGCLRLAADLAKPTGDYSAITVVNTASVLYNFCITSPQPSQAAEQADKPSRRRKSTPETDILS